MKLSKATNNSSNTIAGISATDLRNGITKISQEPLTSVSLSLGIFSSRGNGVQYKKALNGRHG